MRTVLGGLGLLVISWRALPLTAGAGLDPSWNAALHMAAHRPDLAWGPEVAFTYGPLGFLRVNQLYYAGTGLAAALYAVLGTLAYLTAGWHVARRALGPVAAAIVLFVAGYEVRDPLVALALVLVLAHLAGDDRRGDAVAAAVGALGGLEALTKINAGITIWAIGLAAFALSPHGARVRRAGIVAGAGALAFLLLWLATGGALGDIPAYVRNAREVVAGYSAAMGVDQAGFGRQYAYAAVAALVLLAGAFRASRGRGAIVVVLVLYGFLAFKAGFVRNDAAHAPLYFAAMVAAVPALGWDGSRVAALLAAAVCVAPNALASAGAAGRLISPVRHVADAASDLSAILAPGGHVADGRRTVIAGERVDPRLIALLRGHTVHVAPTEADVVWAQRLRWAPLPVFQSYQAYTPRLDDLDARAALGPGAPQRILLERARGIDGRYVPFDAPATTRALLCRYRPLQAAGRWLVLAAGADRCGRPVPVGSVRATWGQTVPVPRPRGRSALVYARVTGVAPSSLGERLRTLLFKARTRTIRFKVRRGPGRPWRLVTAVAGDGMPLVGTPGTDFPRSFAQMPGARAITIDRLPRPQARGTLRISFYEVPLARSSARR